MKLKKIIPLFGVVVATSLMFQSCLGSFSLTNKVLNWNKNVSNKFVNELVFFAFWILPVYEVTSVADLLVLNSIEFWSGNKPNLSHNQVIPTENGDYRIMALENGYKIVSPNGDILNFDFNIETQTWSFSRNDEHRIEFLKFKDAHNVMILNVEGNFVDVELSREGLNNYMHGKSMPMMAYK